MTTNRTRRALVTGATSGLGLEAAAQLAEAGYDEREAVLSYKVLVELVIGSVQRQEARESDPTQEQAESALFYEALANSDPTELPNLAYIAVGWNRRDPDETFEYSLECILAGVEARRGWLREQFGRDELDSVGRSRAASG